MIMQNSQQQMIEESKASTASQLTAQINAKNTKQSVREVIFKDDDTEDTKTQQSQNNLGSHPLLDVIQGGTNGQQVKRQVIESIADSIEQNNKKFIDV